MGLFKRTVVSIPVILLATGAHSVPAQTECAFSTECYETEACTETEFRISYSVTTCPRAPGPRVIFASTEFGALRGQELAPLKCSGSKSGSDSSGYVLTDGNATYLLSVSDQNARLSVHNTSDTSVVTYHGLCKDIK